MSGRRRVKDITYDEDDYDQYEDFDQHDDVELSQEDKERLKKGTIAIKNQLGIVPNLPDAEIEESLWYYYFDLSKTISYLQKRYNLNKSTQSRQDQSTTKLPVGRKETKLGIDLSPAGEDSAILKLKSTTIESERVGAIFFDTPWLSIPRHRQGCISQLPLLPRHGLLGGSSSSGKQTSKLASLSASRRRAQNVPDADSPKKVPPPKATRGQKASVTLLDRLAKHGSNGQGRPHDNFTHQAQQDNQSLDIAATDQLNSAAELKSRTCGRNDETGRATEKPPDYQQCLLLRRDEPVQGSPSLFAKVIAGRNHPRDLPQSIEGDLFTLTYTNHAELTDSVAFVVPSPDDTVSKAQSKDKESIAKSHASNSTTPSAVNTNVPTTKKKLVNVEEEYAKLSSKRNSSFVVIGHVDHGKSTLIGRLLYDLNSINKRQVEKLKKEAEENGKGSFAFAWVMDSTGEERSRGVTIDIATKEFETEETVFTILDAPGHQDFVPNMIAGTSQADFALLVVDASTNAFEAGIRGQTKEHALLARSMGLSNLVIAVNKMDLTGWSQHRFLEIRQQLLAFLLSTGFQERNLAFVPCSGITGDNVVSIADETISSLSWYEGSTLRETLDMPKPAARAIGDPLRFTVNDIFRSGPQNALSIAGRVESGNIQVGIQALAMPSGMTCTVTGLVVGSEAKEWAVAGQIVTVLLEDVDPIHLRIGDVLCDSENHPIRNVKVVAAKLLAFEHLIPMELNLYRGSLTSPASITDLTQLFDKSGADTPKRKPRVVKPGQVAKVEISLDRPLPLETSSRVVLRSGGKTVAAGLVEEAR